MTDNSQFMDTSQVGLADDFDLNKRNSGRGSIGRAPGVTNYNPDKIQIMLEIVQEFVPTNDEEWELVCQKFNQTFHEDRMMKSLKRKYTELVAGGTKTTSHDLTHFVNWAKKLSLRIREKTTGKPYSEPVENSGLILPPPGSDDNGDIQSSGLPWGANASSLPTPALAPRIRKNRLSSPGNGSSSSSSGHLHGSSNVTDVAPVLTFLQMQATTQAQNHQQLVSLLTQLTTLLTNQATAGVSTETATNKKAKGNNNSSNNNKGGEDDDVSVATNNTKKRAQSEDETDAHDDKRARKN